MRSDRVILGFDPEQKLVSLEILRPTESGESLQYCRCLLTPEQAISISQELLSLVQKVEALQ